MTPNQAAEPDTADEQQQATARPSANPPRMTKTPAEAGVFARRRCLPCLRGVTCDQATESGTAGQQQKAAARDQCHIESGERQETTRIGLRWLGRDAGRPGSLACRTATSFACCNLPLRAATCSGIRLLRERRRSQSEKGSNGCKDADSSSN